MLAVCVIKALPSSNGIALATATESVLRISFSHCACACVSKVLCTLCVRHERPSAETDYEYLYMVVCVRVRAVLWCSFSRTNCNSLFSASSTRVQFSFIPLELCREYFICTLSFRLVPPFSSPPSAHCVSFVQVCRPLCAQFKWIYMGQSYTSFHSVRFFSLCVWVFHFRCFIVVLFIVFRTFTITVRHRSRRHHHYRHHYQPHLQHYYTSFNSLSVHKCREYLVWFGPEDVVRVESKIVVANML